MRDQIFTSTRRHLLWTAGAGAVLLAGVFLLGVQAGKQSVALRRPAPADSAEPLQELPENLIDQLQTFETAPPSDKPVQLPPAPVGPPKDGATADAKPEAAKSDDRWTLQLISTPDAAEAKKIAAQAKAAGHPATLVKEKGVYKVRLAKATDRATADATAAKLKKAGIKSFAVKAE
ncbi:MAG TPA: SPOR domain-containing protein [Holophagaceae bacterium]|jgi:cell division protein FtsN|nr:SPOR domain-containing protein [Holophagaceae bacterium]